MDAKAPTAQEIQDFLADLFKKIKQMTCAPGEAPGPSKPFLPTYQPMISLDNASIHIKAVEDKEWLRQHPWGGRRLPLPPYSPDIHKVIEHVHGTITNTFRERLRALKQPHGTVLEYYQEVEDIFYQKFSSDGVSRDQQSLQLTCREILKQNGGYPPQKKFR